jgi:hypothetical protein
MNSLLLLGICTVTWVAWVPATVMQKRARGDEGGTSLFPALPINPLVAWLIGLGLNLLKPNIGTYVIGGLHGILFVAFLGSVVVSAIRIKAMESGPTD